MAGFFFILQYLASRQKYFCYALNTIEKIGSQGSWIACIDNSETSWPLKWVVEIQMTQT